ncbi:hypothetical protein EVAR_43948_1 [Eumeta japonica]|uniref:Uncharacterized protein n=1 Tax=Eumeta variegata TaxID=151549 RepID=A0A4C1Y241_EUMVA|nr:hypothetical protein EVAR_43948_1 [Eumeta japonica]
MFSRPRLHADAGDGDYFAFMFTNERKYDFTLLYGITWPEYYSYYYKKRDGCRDVRRFYDRPHRLAVGVIGGVTHGTYTATRGDGGGKQPAD